MVHNRSAPLGTIVPTLCYPDTNAAIEWLCRAFGFVESVRWGAEDRPSAQLDIGAGSIMLFAPRPDDGLTGRTSRPPSSDSGSHSVMVAVEDVDRHYDRAVAAGARLHRDLQSWPGIGERQYSVLDLAGHLWTFTQSIADIDPKDWGQVPNPPPSTETGDT